MGNITRQNLYWMDKEYKRKVIDKAYADTVKAIDKDCEVRSRSVPLDGVDMGHTIRYDRRTLPYVAGFPKGDRRRW
jgi:hypothetical protein